MGEKDKGQEKKKSFEEGCCGRCGIRLKVYLFILAAFCVSFVILFLDRYIPLTVHRDDEEKKTQELMTSFFTQLDETFTSKIPVAESALRSVNVSDIVRQVRSGDKSKVEYFFNYSFKIQGVWNSRFFGNGIAMYGTIKNFLYGELYDLHPQTFQVLPEKMEIPEQFLGRTNESKRLLNKILLPDRPWKGLLDRNQTTTQKHYPFYFAVSVPIFVPMVKDAVAWAILFYDDRLAIGPIIDQLQVCIADFPGNSVTVPGRKLPSDVAKNVKGLKGGVIGKFSEYNESGGSYKMVVHQRSKIKRGIDTICGSTSKTLNHTGYIGTTYFGFRDESFDDPEKTLVYARMDFSLHVMEEVREFISELLFSFGGVLLFTAIFIIVFLEVGVLMRLDKTKKNIQSIVMERRAILEEYLDDDRFTRDYYESGGKSSKSVLEDIMNEAVRDAAGSGDNLSLLVSMSDQLQKWMEGILNRKMSRLACLKEENSRFIEAMRMMGWWCGRGDLCYTISYLTMNKGLKKEECEEEIGDFMREVNLNHLMGNGIAFEFFKSFCVSIKQEKALQFLIDVGWLGMMEEAGEGVNKSGTSESTMQADRIVGITHSQLVRLSQSIFSYYNLEHEKEGIALGISPSTLKKLQGHVDSKGRFKYARGIYKNAGNEVRKMIDMDIIPMFTESVLFRGMYITLKYTSQIEDTGQGKKGGMIKFYGMPSISGLSDEEISELKKHHDVLERVKLGSYERDDLEEILEESKKTSCDSKPDVNMSSPKSATNSPRLLLSPGGHKLIEFRQSSGTFSPRTKFRSPPSSPLAALLPGPHIRSSLKISSEDQNNDEK